LPSACLYVSLRVCLFTHISKIICPNFTKFSVHRPWLSPTLKTVQYVMYTSCVVDDVMFWSECPESKTTRMFRPVRQVAAPRAKSAVSDRRLHPHATNASLQLRYHAAVLHSLLVPALISNGNVSDCRVRGPVPNTAVVSCLSRQSL